jgi:hypothetical protein
MKTLDQIFQEKKEYPSDINEHLDTFRKYSEQCESVIEMGVRGIVSTWGFMMGKPKKMVGIDITHPSEFGGNLNEVYQIARENDIHYEFRLQNTLTCEIEECDLLFIDTWHDFLHLKKELYRHHTKVKKFLIFHDTATFAFKDEPLYDDYVNEREETNLPKGLVSAINEFCLNNPHWHLHERYANNNGITVLKNLRV